jgi:uncharacterized protein YbjT (DUF2867 family)
MAAQQNKQIVLVFGATGKQGGSVIKALQADNKYHIRGVSRATHHEERATHHEVRATHHEVRVPHHEDRATHHEERATKLQESGVEIFKADISTGEGLDAAFKNVYACFLVTNSFEKGIEGNEFEDGKKLVDKAYANGVKVLVWSSSPNASALSNGKFDVPQFSEKAKVEQYIKELHSQKKYFRSVTFITPTFYYQNFTRLGFCPKRDQKGNFAFKLPQVKNLVGCDVHDIGPIFHKVLNDPDYFNGKNIILDGDQGSIENYVSQFERTSQQPADYQAIKIEEFEKSPELHHGKQLAQMFEFLNEYPYTPTENTVLATKIYPEIKNFRQWLEKSGWKGELHP